VLDVDNFNHEEINFQMQMRANQEESPIGGFKPQMNNSIPGGHADRSRFEGKETQSSSKCVQVTPIEFETAYWLEQFLESLFQLKPSLKTVSYDKFRIVIEFFSAGMGDKRFEISTIEEVIDYLRYVGCKVPVLIYTDIKLNKQMYQRVMQLKKKYLMLFFTNEIVEVRKFCKMEMIRDTHGSNNFSASNTASGGN